MAVTFCEGERREVFENRTKLRFPDFFFFFINFFIKALQGSSDLTEVFVITDYLL